MKMFENEIIMYSILIFIFIIIFGSLFYAIEFNEYRATEKELNFQRLKNELLDLKLKEQELKRKLEVEK